MEDKLSRYFKQFYILIFFVVFLAYALLPVLAPVLMHHGHELPAKLIYWIYQFLCHQLPYRSFFLYGEQPYYPLPEAEMGDSVKTFPEMVDTSEMDFADMREFIGNEQMGYKFAVCQRDFALFLAIALFCLIFFLANSRIPKINLWIWLLFGVAPIAIDGFSQLFSGTFSSIWVVRESTPLLRVLTGGVFGFFTAWFLIPYLNEKIKS